MTRNTGNIKPLVGAALVAMAALSLTGLLGWPIAGLSIFVGIAVFFIDQGKSPAAGSGLHFKAVGKDLANPRIWLWIAMPTVMNLLSMGLAMAVLPQFVQHVLSRTDRILSYGQLPLLAAQLVIAALGEEIAWRAFFQRQLCRVCPLPAALLVTSLLFSLGHFAAGAAAVVAYDLLFILANSIFYGIVFHKTDNAWVSAISHLIANIVSILLMTTL